MVGVGLYLLGSSSGQKLSETVSKKVAAAARPSLAVSSALAAKDTPGGSRKQHEKTGDQSHKTSGGGESKSRSESRC
jgi:hypothetical protein